MKHSGRRTADFALILNLASGLTIESAAVKAGISASTAHRRLADPSFRQRVAECRADMVQRALGKLADSSTAAADTLRRLLKAKAESVRLGAARSLLEFGSKLRESVELEQRVAALELRKANRQHE